MEHMESTYRSIYVSVPEITTADGGAGVTGGAEVHLDFGCPNRRM